MKAVDNVVNSLHNPSMYINFTSFTKACVVNIALVVINKTLCVGTVVFTSF